MQIAMSCPTPECEGELVFVAAGPRGAQLWTRCASCDRGFALQGGALRSVGLAPSPPQPIPRHLHLAESA